MSNSQWTTSRRLVVVSATIPAAASAVTVLSLVSAGVAAQGEAPEQIIAWSLSGLTSAGASRAQVGLGHAAGSVPSVYDAGEDILPLTADTTVFIGGIAGAVSNAVFEVYIK